MKLMRRFLVRGADWFDRHKGRLIALWIIGFSVATIWLILESRTDSSRAREVSELNVRLTKEIAKARLENCKHLSETLRDIYQDTKNDLDNPRSLTYLFFKDHPERLNQARNDLDRRIKQFDPAKCS